MSVPPIIPIAHYPDSPTKFVGQYNGGNQFWGYVVAPFDPESGKEDRWYAVLHKFAEDGLHLETEHWSPVDNTQSFEDQGDLAEERLREMLAQLGKMRFGNIKVQLFQ